MDRRSLNGRVVVVSGGGTAGDGVGNGRAASILLARDGAKVVVIDKDDEAAEATYELIRAEGGQAIPVQADASDPSSLGPAINRVIETWGSIYGLVNVVGVSGAEGSALDVDLEAWALGLRLNLTSMVLTARFCMPSMIERRSGSIVNFGSLAGLPGGVTYPHLLYPTTKTAVVGLTRAMASQHGRQGVRVNCVAPGMVYTPMVTTRGLDSNLREARRESSLLGTEGTAWDVAEAVRFLISDAASWITGIVLPVDAGASALTPISPADSSQG